MKSRNLWGLFYVPTGVYKTQKLLDVHRIHVLLAAVDEAEVFRALQEILDESMLVDAHRIDFQKNTYRCQNNSDVVAIIKRILNYYIGYEWRERVLDTLITHFGLEELCNVANFYINDEQMREMADGGMIIGSHSVSHPVMSKLDIPAQMQELSESSQRLAPYYAQEYRSFCYPYGGAHSYTEDTIQILRNLGYTFAWDVCSRDITAEDFTLRRYALPRYDCNEFPYGQVRSL